MHQFKPRPLAFTSVGRRDGNDVAVASGLGAPGPPTRGRRHAPRVAARRGRRSARAQPQGGVAATQQRSPAAHRARGEPRRAQLPPASRGAGAGQGRARVGRGWQEVPRLPLRVLRRQSGPRPPQDSGGTQRAGGHYALHTHMGGGLTHTEPVGRNFGLPTRPKGEHHPRVSLRRRPSSPSRRAPSTTTCSESMSVSSRASSDTSAVS
eukprot:scaffold61805_cov66-Phaeocystis_antarctica.AAC.1